MMKPEKKQRFVSLWKMSLGWCLMRVLSLAEYGPHLQAAFEHLKWRGFVDVTPLNDGLMVVFTKP